MSMADRFTVGETLHTSSPCDACKQPLKSGERVYGLFYLTTPWRAEDDEYNDYGMHVWHVDCDEGSLAAG
jgi:hypothetical protein